MRSRRTAAWNSLPHTVTDIDTLGTFKTSLKTFVLPSIQLTVTSPSASASEFTTVWRYRNMTIISIIMPPPP